MTSAPGFRVPLSGGTQVSLHTQSVTERVTDEILPMDKAFLRSIQEQRKSLSVVSLSAYPVKEGASELS
jgi:hypothetical protein